MNVDTDFPSPVIPYDIASPRHRARRRYVLLALAAFALGSAYAAFAMVTQVDHLLFPGNEIRLPFSAPGLAVTPPDALAASEERINVLLIGLDRRPAEPENDDYRSDALMVLSIHPQSKEASILSIPRDLWVQVPLPNGGIDEDRINAAYERGSLLNAPGGAIGLLKKTMEHNFGINIDYYVILDFAGFVKLIDAMGGIEMDIPDHVAYWYSMEEIQGQERWFEIDPGHYLMTGDDALAYARYRQDSDLYRVQRQQRVLLAAVSKAWSLNMLARAPQLWDKYHNTIKTDISAFRVPGLAALLQGISPDRVHTYTLGDAVDGFQTLGGALVLRLLPDQGAPIIGSAFRPPEITKEHASISVYSGRADDAQTRRIALYLELQGLPMENFTYGPAPAGTNYDAPLILYRPSAEITARFIARWLKLERAMRVASLGDTLPTDIVVMLGSDTNPALVALPGTDKGAAPASRFVGIGAPPQFNPYRPPPSYFTQPDSRRPAAAPRPNVTATPLANPFAPTPVPNPFNPAPPAPATPAPTNPFNPTPPPTANPFGGVAR